MNIEFEATFLQVDKDDVRTRLKNAGAELIHPEFLMKRTVFDPPIADPGAWMRVRQEYDKVTMSYKKLEGERIEDQKEVELTIDNFQHGVDLLKTIGAQEKAYQETLRESWMLNGVAITIDTWPGLHPFVEIESDTEDNVKAVAKTLGFDYDTAVFGDVSFVYKQELGIPFDVIRNEIREITFDNPPKQY